jgi:hypothetical protein
MAHNYINPCYYPDKKIHPTTTSTDKFLFTNQLRLFVTLWKSCTAQLHKSHMEHTISTCITKGIEKICKIILSTRSPKIAFREIINDIIQMNTCVSNVIYDVKTFNTKNVNKIVYHWNRIVVLISPCINGLKSVSHQPGVLESIRNKKYQNLIMIL